jgi:hypothetical protein
LVSICWEFRISNKYHKGQGKFFYLATVGVITAVTTGHCTASLAGFLDALRTASGTTALGGLSVTTSATLLWGEHTLGIRNWNKNIHF